MPVSWRRPSEQINGLWVPRPASGRASLLSLGPRVRWPSVVPYFLAALETCLEIF